MMQLSEIATNAIFARRFRRGYRDAAMLLVGGVSPESLEDMLEASSSTMHPDVAIGNRAAILSFRISTQGVPYEA